METTGHVLPPCSANSQVKLRLKFCDFYWWSTKEGFFLTADWHCYLKDRLIKYKIVLKSSILLT